jgi:hypothetical protein
MIKRTTIAATAVLLIAVLAVPASAGWFDKGRIEGSDRLETRDFDLDDFEAIELNGSLDIEITVGEKQSVAVSLDDNLFDNLEIDVDRGTLVVDWEESCEIHRKSRIVITMPKLEGIELNGAGDINYWGDPEHEKTRVSGLGDIDKK